MCHNSRVLWVPLSGVSWPLTLTSARLMCIAEYIFQPNLVVMTLRPSHQKNGLVRPELKKPAYQKTILQTAMLQVIMVNRCTCRISGINWTAQNSSVGKQYGFPLYRCLSLTVGRGVFWYGRLANPLIRIASVDSDHHGKIWRSQPVNKG